MPPISRKNLWNVVEDLELPRGLCTSCSSDATTCWNFKKLCLDSSKKWARGTNILLENHYDLNTSTLFICFDTNTTIKDDGIVGNPVLAAARLNFINGLTKCDLNVKATSCSIRCRNCGQKFASVSQLNRHIKTTMKQVCKLCNTVHSKQKLAKHLKTHNLAVYACDICYDIFNKYDDLSAHTVEVHLDRTNECKVCGVGFKSLRSLNAHMYSHTLFHCEKCKTTFENLRCYRYHRSQCTNNVSKQNYFECDHCGIKYTKKPSLRIHIIQKHLNVLPFACYRCGKRCSTKAHLLSHESTHDEERKTYECFCGAKMFTEIGYTLHQRIHSGETPYKCTECDEQFLSASRRLDHIKRRHRNIKDMPHGCSQCSARFLRPFELKRHFRVAHSVENGITH